MQNYNKYDILSEYFGHKNFRDGQEQIIDNILSGKDCLGVMPTGAGKSLCYQVPALMFDGITIVVSPLISLMKDQVNSLIQSGVRAAYLNSSLTPAQFETAVANAKRGMYKIIYAAPERLCTPSFLSLARTVKISQLTVDEAHCVSQWGQDFRPSYTKIPEFLSNLPYRPTVTAFTATATARVKEDIVKLLNLKDPFCITTGFDRKNLYFGVIHPKNKYEQTKAIVGENKDKCGIIYCSTRKNVEEVCEKLNADGYCALRYHAGLTDEERRKNQDDFIFDRASIMVATNAFGMGIDKSNVGYVIHYNMPKNIESYYQEAGRAGRDGEEAKCILLYSGQDVRTNKFLIENSNDNPDLDEEALKKLHMLDLKRLKAMTDYCNTTNCLREYILKYFGETLNEPCGNCSGCTGHFETVDITVESQKILSCIYRLHQRNLRFGGGIIAQILQGADNAKINQFGLKTLSTYGIMKDCTQVKIRQITDYLKSRGYIAEGEFSTLTLTRSSAEILNQKITVSMRMRQEVKEDKASKTAKGQVVPFDRELFENLKKLRAKIAKDISMPAYIIFPDSSLRDMCIRLPKNSSEFLEVSGVGKTKCDRYGRFFIAEIRQYLNQNPKAADNAAGTENMGILQYLQENSHKLCSIDEELTLTGLCDEILSQLGVNADKAPIKNAVKNWLINENYLREEITDGKTLIKTTILSGEAGITEVEKIYSGNRVFKSVVFPKSAQEFIFSNINEITDDNKLEV